MRLAILHLACRVPSEHSAAVDERPEQAAGDQRISLEYAPVQPLRLARRPSQLAKARKRT
jgi:hypothetical protein